MKVAPSADRARERAVVNSACWAAAGDALGWITELTDEDGVERRSGSARVTVPVAWTRVIGGRSGAKVSLPAGTYSDDTQLRLAVCRAIRGNGAFDAEAFAKVELTVWPSYSLGGGRGTKCAAANLVRRDVNWFSNFFSTREQDYLHAGGNGAAMRVQPHVWTCPPERKGGFLADVLRDALITHGHPHGFCGAVLHALMLEVTLAQRSIPGLGDWHVCVDQLEAIPAAVDQDRQLSAFWRPAWEHASGMPLTEAVMNACNDLRRDIDAIRFHIEGDDRDRYQVALEAIGCFDPKLRGSGVKTTLAAAALAWLTRNQGPYETLILGANVLGSDTDTIATMAGAVRGLIEEHPPTWPIQDRPYIEEEARRLAKIALGEVQDSFAYPDLARWAPPANQSDAVGRLADGLALIGLGAAVPQGEVFTSRSDGVWQWLTLSFGQTVLAKRRQSLRVDIRPELLPDKRRPARATELNRAAERTGIERTVQRSLPLSDNRAGTGRASTHKGYGSK